jgi:gamma-glutamyltranspeptidase/glutathione hydrolase
MNEHLPAGTTGSHRLHRVFRLAAASMAIVGAAGAGLSEQALPPEFRAHEARSDFGMVATGSHEATEAAVAVLEDGGNAIDAAVAAALVLGVADADASGIGGMTYMVIHLADGSTVAVDGSTRAPMVIDMTKLQAMKADGRNWGYETIAAPTTLATLEHARRRFGTRSMAELLQPAIGVAERGYPVTPIQITWTRKYYDNILRASAYMPFLAMEDGRTIPSPGDRQCQPDLARTLRRLAAEGVQSFYIGRMADEIEADVVRNGGFLRKADLARVRVREVPPLHTTYRGRDVFTFPPPGGGGVLIAALNILENFPSELLAGDSVDRHQILVEAFRIAAADGAKAGADTGQTAWGGNRSLSKANATDGAAQIVPGKIIPRDVLWGSMDPGCEKGGESTTQVSVADEWGNVVSLTQTLSRSFGAQVATPELGFCYNSFLESFNVDDPRCPGYLQPNSLCTSDMAPTIVLDGTRLLVALGTPGSNRIAPIIAEVISNLVDRRMTIRDAVTAPRILWGGMRYLRVWIELVEPFSEADVAAFERIGYQDMTVLRLPAPDDDTAANFGGVNAVAFDPSTGGFTGVADPRRGGLAMGPRVVVAGD